MKLFKSCSKSRGMGLVQRFMSLWSAVVTARS